MKTRHYFIVFLMTMIGLSIADVYAQQVNFSTSTLKGIGVTNPTSLQFGPDGRLYVSQQNGVIYALTIKRTGDAGQGSYTVTNSEKIMLIKDAVPNFNDDGERNFQKERQVTGLMVTGTAQNPVLYVSSSDWRIAVGNDSNLDTNSGVISRLTKKGASWEKVDIVRGFPRCEENHGVNGMELDKSKNILYLAIGGNTNKGAPSANFATTPEYAYAAAIVSVDLNKIEALPVFTDPRTNTKYIYDLPTIDDPTRPNIDNTSPDFPYPSNHPMYNETIDKGDPYGGNDGLNQAKLEINGPVEIYSPGHRNPYDLVVMQNGKMYTFDNGPNTGWGGYPKLNGGKASAELNEENSQGDPDQLHYIKHKGFYGGHPNPVRANPKEAGLYVYKNENGGWKLQKKYNFGSDLESPVPDALANPEEAIYKAPFKGQDGSLKVIYSSVNGMDEYTASNFGGKLKGNLLAAAFKGQIYRFKLNGAGDKVDEDEVLFDGFGQIPLDVTAQGDNAIYPGTIWVACYGSNQITVFEPNEAGNTGCLQPGNVGYDPTADYDGDGYTNQDEVDNNSNLCSAGSFPNDADKDNISDLNDPDDDNDGIPDKNDAFVIDPNNGLSTNLPVNYPLWNNDPGTGFFGIGFTGIMTNGATDYLNQYDPIGVIAGGAAGKFTIKEVAAGDAFGGMNSQKDAFQFGVNVSTNSQPFTIHSKLEPPFFAVDGSPTTPINAQSFGIQMGAGDQNNYMKVVVTANNGQGGAQMVLEVDGAASIHNIGVFELGNLLEAKSVDLYFSVDPATLTSQAFISLNGGGTIIPVGPAVEIPEKWLSPTDKKGLAVGVIATSIGSNQPFSATWDLFEVKNGTLGQQGNNLPFIADIPNQIVAENQTLIVVVEASDTESNKITISSNNMPDFATINDTGGGKASITLSPKIGDRGNYVINVTATDEDGFQTSSSFNLAVAPVQSGSQGSPTDGLVFNVKSFQSAANRTPLTSYNKLPANVRVVDNGDGTSTITIYTSSGNTETFEVPTPSSNLRTAEEILKVLASFDEAEKTLLYRVNAGGPTVGDEPMPWGMDLRNTPSPYLVSKSSEYTSGPHKWEGKNDTDAPDYVFGNFRSDINKGDDMHYSFTAPVEGFYYVKLYFREPTPNQTRIFDVSAESKIVIDNLNTSAQGEHPFSKGFQVEVKDGKLDIMFHHVEGRPMVNAIQVYFLGDEIEIPIDPEDPIEPEEPEPGNVPIVRYRINTGGGEVKDLPMLWMKDVREEPSEFLKSTSALYSTGKKTYDGEPNNTNAPDNIFATRRYDMPWGDNMKYEFPIETKGPVKIKFFFKEVNDESKMADNQKRVFNVKAENTYILKDFSMYNEAGLNPMEKEFTVDVNDGNLTIVFEHVKGYPSVNAIEISIFGHDLPPEIEPVADQVVNAGETVDVSIKAKDPENLALTTEIKVIDKDGNTVAPDAYTFTDKGNGEYNFKWTTTAEQRGDYKTIVSVSDNVHKIESTFNIKVKDLLRLAEGQSWCLNAGGDEYKNETDTYNANVELNYPMGSQVYKDMSIIEDIANTKDDILYLSERYGTDFTFDIPIMNGSYDVVLCFAEIYQGVKNEQGEGSRVFSTDIEGKPVLRNLDILAEARAPLTVVKKTFTVEVTDQSLNIRFYIGDGDINNAKVSAICITSNTPIANRPPEIEPVAEIAIAEEQKATTNIKATDADGDPIEFSMVLKDENGQEIPRSEYTFTDYKNGTALFSWQTEEGDAGIYTATVSATDGIDITDLIFQIKVSAKGTVIVNSPPEIGRTPTLYVKAGDKLDRSYTVPDAEGDPVTLSMVITKKDGQAIDNYKFTENANTGRVEWNTKESDVGTYYATLTAETEQHEVSKSFAIRVRSAQLPNPSGNGQSTAKAKVEIGSNQYLTNTSVSMGSFKITNLSENGIKIEKVVFDLRTTILPDLVFDPVGNGGDDAKKCLTPDSGAKETGFIEPVESDDPEEPKEDLCTTPFKIQHNGGYDQAMVSFTDFNPNEKFTFSVDVDPNSIKGESGISYGGPVSGYEMIGALITVTFSDGTVYSGNLFDVGGGNLGKGEIILEGTPKTKPTIKFNGSTNDVTLDKENQTITVQGVPNTTVTILQMDARLSLQSFEGKNYSKYYANEAMEGKNLYTAVIGSNGSVSVPIKLLKSAATEGGGSGGINHFMAFSTNGSGKGATSNVLRVKYQPSVTINSTDKNIEIFPNPSSGVFTLRTPNEALKVTIYNVMGKVVFEESLPPQTEKQIQLPSNALASKVLFLKAINEEGEMNTQRILISK